MSSRTILRTTQTLARNTLRPHTQTASLSSTSRLRGEGDVGPNKTHMTDKTGGHKDVQSDNAKGAHEERASGNTNSQATSQKDTRNNNERAKKDIPEAPEPVIGMNEERGGKGH